MMIRWLDGGFLVDCWDQLDLPDPVRDAWEPAVRARDAVTLAATSSPGTSDEDPETGPVWPGSAGMEFLPKPPPPPPPRAVPVRPTTLNAGFRYARHHGVSESLLDRISIDPEVVHGRPPSGVHACE